MLIFTIIPVNSTFAEVDKDILNRFDISETILDGKKAYIIENNSSGELKIKVIEEGNKTVYETYLDNKFIDKTIIFSNSNKILYYDNKGNKTLSTFDDYIIDTKDTINNKLTHTPPSDYYLIHREYSSTWDEWGYLYGKNSITYGPTKQIVFPAGTAVSTIIGVIGAIFTGGILGVVIALGATVVGATIDTAISGSVFSRQSRWDYEVTSQGELGLRTYKIDIDAKVINARNGEVSWVDLSERGDTRSWSDLVHAGIYNVILLN
ncbi:hypothetical protein SAMN05216225_105318 [Ornithinibacillus halophilus]|uniref:Uncharacterized protein n=2 Tax=Ornithinibacillus halophilus TaxID=930117 RepID=A0A1M5M2Y1_9BACI|nr:hypothetical protein SAMN05216225_105318 [Ornithinibacillus halophilus]